MSIKQIIAIIVIVVAFAGAGVFVYMAFSGTTQTPPNLTANGGAPASQILPYGSGLDFGQVTKFNKNGRVFDYPVVTEGEVGAELGTVIK